MYTAIADTRLLVRGSVFQIGAWQRLLDSVAKELHPRIEAICPFGFELLGDRAFLARPLSRFYPLLKVPAAEAQQADALAAAFLEGLMGQLADLDPSFHASVVLLRYNRSHTLHLAGNSYRRRDTDRAINLLARVTDADILDDYAHYLIAAIRCIPAGTLGECARYGRDVRARRRLLQLAIMAEALMAELGALSHPIRPQLLPRLRDYDSEFEDFYRGYWEAPPSAAESRLLEQTILPAMRDYAARLRVPLAGEPMVELQVQDMYTGVPLRTRLPRPHYLRLRDRVRDSYRAFLGKAC